MGIPIHGKTIFMLKQVLVISQLLWYWYYHIHERCNQQWFYCMWWLYSMLKFQVQYFSYSLLDFGMQEALNNSAEESLWARYDYYIKLVPVVRWCFGDFNTKILAGIILVANRDGSSVWYDINTLRLRWNEQHFADDIFKRIFFNENVWISIKISLKFVPKGPINNIPALVQIMAWRCWGDKPLSEPMMVSLLMHICLTQPQWVKVVHVTESAIYKARLTHWGRDKMAAILQTTFFKAF